MLRVKKLSADAIIPTRGSSGAAGYDLSSALDVTIPAKGKALVATDIAIAVPEGTYGRVGILFNSLFSLLFLSFLTSCSPSIWIGKQAFYRRWSRRDRLRLSRQRGRHSFQLWRKGFCY